MASLHQELLGRLLDGEIGAGAGGSAPVPSWWHDDGSPASYDEVLNEIRDRIGVYAMQKRARYLANQASLKAKDDKTRFKLIDLRAAIDIPDPKYTETVRKLYDAINKDPAFNSELDAMLKSIHYG
jgi:hypothetical protein